jgi:hypothetical protein
MTRSDELAEQFKGSIIGRLGPEAEETIFKGKAAPDDPAKRAQWVKEALTNLDETTEKKIVQEIMRGSGVNCANHNIGVVKNSLKRRARFTSLDSFIDAEIKKPVKGTALERDGEALILRYLPQKFSHPMRCFCGLVNSLPRDEILSETYCGCSVGFVETWWSQVIGKPVKVQLLESAITGSDICRFRITW